MSFRRRAPAPTDALKQWAERIVDFLATAKSIIVDRITFDTTNPSSVETGDIAWNTDENCFNLGMPNGVVAQIPYENMMRIYNDTGSTIPNGAVVGFDGVNGEINGAPYIADGSISELYFIGVATESIANASYGNVTIYGKVRDIDTSAWSVGDILYASAATGGALTNTRPTAPNAVIVVAAVMSSHATNGVIMVRPTIPMGLRYGTFSSTSDQTIAATDTAYPIEYNVTNISNGVTVENDGSGNATQITFAEAGFYTILVQNQYTSTSSSQKNIQAWLRKNGTDVSATNTYITTVNNGASALLTRGYDISLQSGDYVQVMWASSSVDVSLNAIPATAYSPSAPSALLTVTQTQL